MALFKNTLISPEIKAAALKEAVRLWRLNEFERATALCKKYGITDAELAHAVMIDADKDTTELTREQLSALQLALKMWNSGRYEKATGICTKYKISIKDFNRALFAASRSSK